MRRSRRAEDQRFAEIWNHIEPEYYPPMTCSCQVLEAAAPDSYSYDLEEVWRKSRGRTW
jgi:hypothetical protein